MELPAALRQAVDQALEGVPLADLRRAADSRSVPIRVSWVSGDIETGLPALPQGDLVTLANVLDELPPALITRLVDQLWNLTGDMLVVVEPGTPAGWRRILAVRDRLIAAGAHPRRALSASG
jgi:ribosomal protein RSM22 (predicted rRNA methylase)